jgi:sulfonate transport system permease protein
MKTGQRAVRRGSLVATLLAVALWYGVASLRFAGKAIIATPVDTVRGLPAAWSDLVLDVMATTLRASVGLGVGVLGGVAVGTLAALAMRRAPVVDGLLDFARSVPPVVLLPMFLLALGYDETARIATVAAGCAWTMALSVTTAAASERSARRELLHLAGATRWQAALWTQPWEALPALAVGLRASASTAVIVAVVTEMVAGAERGVGSRVISAQIASDTTVLTLNVLAIGAVGYAANVGLRRLEEAARRFR